MAIYLFRDIGYELGIKVGRGDPIRCLAEAQGYTPRGMECVACWDVPVSEEASLEKLVHAELRREMGVLSLPTDANPRNGREWFKGPASRGVTIVGAFLKLDTMRPSAKVGRVFDKLRSEPEYKGRLVLWMMEEFETGALKLYQCSEWKSPLEIRRRYSRNGFSQVAAFAYVQNVSRAANWAVDRLRRDCIRTLGSPAEREEYGWFVPGVTATAVAGFLVSEARRFVIELRKLSDISTPVGRPCGVRISYTGDATIPTSEIQSCFDEVWWK